MPLAITLLSLLVLVLGLALYFVTSDLRKLQYICLTNARMSFYRSVYYNKFMIKVHSKNSWVGDIDKVYDVFKAPGAYQAKLESAENRDVEEPAIDSNYVYKPGKWKEK